MNSKILTIFTRTPLHVGAGSSVGAIDQPVIRERHTGFPIIPGSAVKGVIADLWPREGQNRSAEAVRLFGAEDANAAAAGALLVGEAKLLAFPVRSAKGAFAWLTCPLALNRFARDTRQSLAIPEVTVESVLVAGTTAKIRTADNQNVIFEEYPLAIAGDISGEIIAALKPVCDDAIWQSGYAAHLAVISNELFSYFAVNACEIAQHIRIDDTTGVVKKGALFNQENVPSETVFYAPMHTKTPDALDLLAAKLAGHNNFLQFGGDATTGLGYCSVNLK